MSTESVGSCSSFLQPRKLFEEYLEENLQIAPGQMNNPFFSPRQQEDHFRNTVSDGVSPHGAVSIPSDRPVKPMTIAQNTHGAVYSPSSQDGHFTRDHNTCQPTRVPTSQNTPEAVSPDGYNRNKCFISGVGGSGPPDRQATREMNGEDVPKIQCPCGSGTCIVRTSNTEKNPNRRFYTCPAKIKCNFFQWFDGLGPSSQSPLKPSQGCSRSPGKIINPQNPPLEPKEPTCSCKAGPCIVQTMHQGENKGRKYYACPIRKGYGACKHFEWVDSPVKPPETESNSKRNQNNISIVDVTTPEPKQTLSPYESVKDLFGENDMRTVDFWCKEQDPNSTAATGTEISKQISPGKRPHPHQPNTMGEISPMKRLNLSDAFQLAENCGNCGKRGECIECPILICFKDDDFSENKQGNAMDGGNISPIKGTSVQNISPVSLKRAGKCFNCGKEGHWRLECTSPRGTNSACFKCGKAGHWMKNCNL